MTEKRCYYCNRPDGKGPRELRPYGPGGAYVCAECIMGDLEKDNAAAKQFAEMLDKADGKTGSAVLTPEGPIPYINKDQS